MGDIVLGNKMKNINLVERKVDAKRIEIKQFSDNKKFGSGI